MGGEGSGRHADPITKLLALNQQVPQIEGNEMTYLAGRGLKSGVAVGQLAGWELNGTSIHYPYGNVGIGTTSPGQKLEVVVGDVDGIKINATTTSRPSLFFANANTGLLTQQTVTNTADWQLDVGVGAGVRAIEAKANGNVLLSQSQGNVGIGTTGPTLGKLQVTQTSNAATGGITAINSGVTTGAFLWADTGTVAHLDAGSGGSDTLALNIGGGKVGIGTTTPDTILMVSGAQTFFNATAPTLVTASGAVFVSGGALWFKGSSGTQTRLAVA